MVCIICRNLEFSSTVFMKARYIYIYIFIYEKPFRIIKTNFSVSIGLRRVWQILISGFICLQSLRYLWCTTNYCLVNIFCAALCNLHTPLRYVIEQVFVMMYLRRQMDKGSKQRNCNMKLSFLCFLIWNHAI